jgi:hypothetical protein
VKKTVVGKRRIDTAPSLKFCASVDAKLCRTENLSGTSIISM